MTLTKVLGNLNKKIVQLVGVSHIEVAKIRATAKERGFDPKNPNFHDELFTSRSKSRLSKVLSERDERCIRNYSHENRRIRRLNYQDLHDEIKATNPKDWAQSLATTKRAL